MLLINCDEAPALNPGWSVRTSVFLNERSSPHHTVKCPLQYMLLNPHVHQPGAVVSFSQAVVVSSRVSTGVCQMVTEGDGQCDASRMCVSGNVFHTEDFPDMQR